MCFCVAARCRPASGVNLLKAHTKPVISKRYYPVIRPSRTAGREER